MAHAHKGVAPSTRPLSGLGGGGRRRGLPRECRVLSNRRGSSGHGSPHPSPGYTCSCRLAPYVVNVSDRVR